MIRRKIRVTAQGGIHMAVAAALSRVYVEEGNCVFLRAGKRMASIRDIPKMLALGVHEQDEVEVIADGEEEISVIEQIEKMLCN